MCFQVEKNCLQELNIKQQTQNTVTYNSYMFNKFQQYLISMGTAAWNSYGWIYETKIDHNMMAKFMEIHEVLNTWIEAFKHRFKIQNKNNKANLRDLIAANGLVNLLKLNSNHRFLCVYELQM